MEIKITIKNHDLIQYFKHNIESDVSNDEELRFILLLLNAFHGAFIPQPKECEEKLLAELKESRIVPADFV